MGNAMALTNECQSATHAHGEPHSHTNVTALGLSVAALSPRTRQNRGKWRKKKRERDGEICGQAWVAVRVHQGLRSIARMCVTLF